MFTTLKEINKKPKAFKYYTAPELWTDEHTSKEMLKYHLNETIDAASRNVLFVDKSAQWISEYFGFDNNFKVIDFGCGPGLYTSRFAQYGAKVTGLDFSKRSIEYAKNEANKQKLRINHINTNYLNYQTDEKFDLITMIMCDFTVLSPEQRKSLLIKFGNLLSDKGSVLLDVYSLAYYDSVMEKAIYEFNQLSNFWSPEDYYCFLNTFKYDQEKVILDKYTIFEKARTRTIYNWLQCFNEESIKREFEECGLKVTQPFSNVAGDPFDNTLKEFAIVAKKI